MSKQSIRSVSVGPMFLLFLLFLSLRLTEQISWSWWWVTAPLWGPMAILLAIALVTSTVVGVIISFRSVARRWIIWRTIKGIEREVGLTPKKDKNIAGGSHGH